MIQHLTSRPMGFPFLCMCIQLTWVVIQHVLLLMIVWWQHPPYTWLVWVHVWGRQWPPPGLRLLPWVTERGWGANWVPRIGSRSAICHVCSISNQSSHRCCTPCWASEIGDENNIWGRGSDRTGACLGICPPALSGVQFAKTNMVMHLDNQEP